MGVRSFLVYVAADARDTVTRTLEDDPTCEVYPAENHGVIVVVSDLDDREAEEALDERLASMAGVLNVALVAGYEK